MDNRKIYDLIIIGAGPAGSIAALYAHRARLNVLLLDKEDFPRDKICGDAISGKSMTILGELGFVEEAQKLPGAHIHSVLFSSPQGISVDIPLQGSKRNDVPTGLVIPRKIFDSFLFEKAKSEVGEVRTGFQVRELIKEDNQVVGVKGHTQKSNALESYYGKIIVGADGFNSIVARKTGMFSRDPNHWIIAVRQYYKNVSDLGNQIELHFVDELIPGYFWIFPAGENLANVGFGILQSALQKKPLDFKTTIDKITNSDAFRSRFKQSSALTEIAAWNLPVASIHRKNYGPGFMLTGDAAGLIDPFTGGGIDNAMISGKLAAQTAKQAIDQNSFDEEMMAEYDRILWAKIGKELQTSTLLQKIGQNRFLFNLVLRKAANNPDVKELISDMMANKVSRRKLANPLFYLKLLFR